jgi:hypothetical protein
MDRPRDYLCRARNRAVWHRFACEPFGLRRDIGAHYLILERASPVGLLVWPPRDQAESAPDRPPHPQFGRERHGTARRRRGTFVF